MDWWEQLEKWAEEMSQKYNVFVEIHDAVRQGKKKNRYLMKLGIYPWGTTFVEGTLEELEEFIKTIVKEEIDKPQYSCPFCGTKYSLRDLSDKDYILEKGSLCLCGAKLLIADSKSSFHIHDNPAFEEIEKLLTPFEREQVKFFVFEIGFFVEDVFKNVKFDWINGWPAYWIKGEKPIVRKEYEIQQIRPVEYKLIKEGYSLWDKEISYSYWNCSVWRNPKEHKIAIEYDIFEVGDKAKYQTIWIEVKGILTTKQIWTFEEKTETDYVEELSEILDGELFSFACNYEWINALPIEPNEFLEANLERLKQELENKFSSAQLKLLEKFNLSIEELEENT